MLSQEEIKNIKSQIIKQIESTFPEDKKNDAIEQIESMNHEELEIFLEKNNLNKENPRESKCIFCSIVFGDIPSSRIEESRDAVGILEINPVSRGHVIIIPKEHISEEKKISKSVLKFANSVAKKLKKLKPKKIDIVPSSTFGHWILNVIPVYNDEGLNSKRHHAEKEELEEVMKIFSAKKEKSVKKPAVKKISENLWLPRRRP